MIVLSLGGFQRIAIIIVPPPPETWLPIEDYDALDLLLHLISMARSFVDGTEDVI